MREIGPDVTGFGKAEEINRNRLQGENVAKLRDIAGVRESAGSVDGSRCRPLLHADRGVVIADSSGKRSMLEGTAVLALGLKRNERLFESLRGKVPEVYTIGDCVEPRRVLNAIWEGFRTARLI